MGIIRSIAWVMVVLFTILSVFVTGEVRISDTGILPHDSLVIVPLHQSNGEMASDKSVHFFNSNQAAGTISLTKPMEDHYPLIVQDTSETLDLKVKFNAAPSSGRVPLMVLFVDLSTGNPTRWLWDFGDGYSSTAENPIHTYTDRGKFTVTLTVSDSFGRSKTLVKENYIIVHPLSLHAQFVASPDKGVAPLTVRFTDQSEGAMIWLWDFGDQSSGSMIPNPTHTYNEAGTYQAKLTVSNGLSESDSALMSIEVLKPGEITANFMATPQFGIAPLAVSFSDKSTGDPVGWLWDFGDGVSDTTKSPTHTYVRAGVYSVTLIVYDREGNPFTMRKDDFIVVTGHTPEYGAIPISAGWNFISVPGKLEHGYNTALIFEHIDVDGHSAFVYEPGLMQQWVPLTRESKVEPLYGIWIYSKKTDSVPLKFDPASHPVLPARELVKGWNAIGFHGFDKKIAKDALFSIREHWKYCLGYNGFFQKYNEMIINGYNDDVQVSPYGGYWVFLTNNGLLAS
jgi:PKD repeat protein